ncbi:MAG: glycosyltransferase family 39 protein [Nitrospinota bacterium]
MKEQVSDQVLLQPEQSLEYNNEKGLFTYLTTGFRKVTSIRLFFKSHLAIALLLPFSFLIIFTGLDDSVLQVDEGADTFISTTILKHGLPMHSDGFNHTMLYADIFDGIFIYRTWIPYYIQAASFYFLGQNTFAARLPFALAGLFSILALYHLALRLTKEKSVAIFAATLLATSVPALLYFRTSRYVAIPILLTPILLLFYLDLFDKKKWNPVPFTATSIIFFHTMYVEFAGLIMGLLFHLYIFRKNVEPENLKRIKFPAFITAISCLPWLLFIPTLSERISEFYTSTSLLIDTTHLGFFKHFAGFFFQINNYIFPLILVPFLILCPLKKFGREVSLLLISIFAIVLVASLHSIPLLQYISASIPLLFVLLGWIIFYLFKTSIVRQVLFTAIMIFTNAIHVGPLVPVRELLAPLTNPSPSSIYLQGIHETFMREVQFKSVFFQYWRELANPYQGPLDKIVSYFETHGKNGETCYIDNELESLTFYTGFKMIHNSELNKQSKPDWIVLRGDQWNHRSEKKTGSVKDKLSYILSANEYEHIELNAPVKRINNSYEVQIHLFQSPSSTDKVNIFRRISKT